MKLIRCKVCYREISNKEKTCSNCGAENKQGAWFLTLMSVGFLSLSLWLAIYINEESGIAPPPKKQSIIESKPKPSAKHTAIDQLTLELESIKLREARTFKGLGHEALLTQLLTYSIWADIIEKAKEEANSPEQRDLISKFHTKVSQTQKDELPKIRDAYGPAIRKKLWEFDGTAKTVGKNYTTIKIQSPDFISNRNIKATHESMSEIFHKLRFKRVEYRWSKYQDEYTFINVNSSEDIAIINWIDSSTYRKIESP